MFHDGKFEDILQSENQPAPRNQAGFATRRNVFRRLLTLLAALPISGILQTRALAATIDTKAEPGFYKIVTYQVPPEHWQDFLEICQVNAEASLKESGITSFAVLLPRDAANTVVAVEAYRDEDASKTHQQTAHFQAFVQAAQRFGVKRSVVEATGYYPN